MKLHILITCSQRKQTSPSRRYCLQDLAFDTLEERCLEWISRLQEEVQERMSATKLYQGEHWSVGTELLTIAQQRGFDAQLWVCSAGYGLIRHDHLIQPYAATFASGQPDSIGSQPEQWQAWWKGLSEWSGPGAPRSIQQLVKSNAEATLFLVASKSYLQAMEQDVAAAIEEISDPDRFLILSSGTDELGALTPNLLPANARLQSLVGGARQALNVRVARWVLNQADAENMSSSTMSALLQASIDEQPELTKLARLPLTDEDIIKFIEEAIAQNPSAAHSPLLRQLRNDGFACEQKRFRTLFLQVKQTLQEQPSHLTLFPLD